MEIGVILVAAGEGSRFGGPKAFVELAGLTLLARSAAAFGAFADRVAVLRAADLDRVDLPGWTPVAGGARRRDSVAAGLEALAPATGIVLVHDAARPLVPPEVVARVAEAATHAPAVVPVVPVTDTIKHVEGRRVVETPDRAALVAVQTPQAFRVDLLRRALEASDSDATDEAALVEALGVEVVTVAGDPQNLKITAPADLQVAAALLQD
ncbi:MAG: 2-C-methyl-D-erythritol 4-phosphate cytidylyltransferase [Planctomycetota bacterium]|jgi:2-C-methyl-D-erythritol 4-phosphate cytidylyltransferase